MPGDVNISSEALEEFLKGDLGDFLETTKSIDKTVQTIQMTQEQGLVTPEGVTKALEDFLEKGASVLDTMTIYCNNMPDAESVNAFSSLMNSMASAINRIAALYKTEQAHRYRIELEEKKHELKMKEIEYREKLKTKNRNPEATDDEEDGETMVEVSTKDIVDQLIRAKQK